MAVNERSLRQLIRKYSGPWIGLEVRRAAALIPQTAALGLFQIIGGRILMNLIIGEVVVAIGAVANNTKLVANGDGALVSSDLCAVLDINGFAAGRLLTVSAAPTTALTSGTSASPINTSGDRVIHPGTIDLDCAGNSVTGTIKWLLRYQPIDPGAHVRAVAIP